MSEHIRNTSGEHLRALCQEAIALVHRLPGPVRRIAIQTTDHAIEVEWPSGDVASAPMVTAPPSAAVSQTLAAVPEQTPTADDGAATHVVRAPLVGTFYRRLQPEADPFVTVGEIVEVGQTVAIVEAMKLLNHIVTEVAGRVVEICANDGEPVEFEQPLVRILSLVDDQIA